MIQAWMVNSEIDLYVEHLEGEYSKIDNEHLMYDCDVHETLEGSEAINGPKSLTSPIKEDATVNCHPSPPLRGFEVLDDALKQLLQSVACLNREGEKLQVRRVVDTTEVANKQGDVEVIYGIHYRRCGKEPMIVDEDDPDEEGLMNKVAPDGLGENFGNRRRRR